MLMYVATFSTIITLWLVTSYLKWRRDVYNLLKKLSVDLWLPIIGTKYKFIGVKKEDLFTYAMSLREQNGPLFCTWSGSEAEIAITKAEHLEIIMNNSVHIAYKGTQ
ncbi:hypothetical protein Trydic_g1457 [Trypoxylus dichotomus]